MNREIINQVFPEMLEKIDNGQCPTCGRKIKEGEFRNEISKKEFKISGMCQECQDNVFGKD